MRKEIAYVASVTVKEMLHALSEALRAVPHSIAWCDIIDEREQGVLGLEVHGISQMWKKS